MIQLTVDTWLGVTGALLAAVDIGATIYAVVDARRERNKREKAVIVANSVIDRTYGLLVGLKPSIPPQYLDAVNDGLAAINSQRETLKGL